ncbi:MAG: hypothetical protein GX575_23880 [Candidatus Anammoximicrobium sp.]|nr:hypothetical protein [Candidatus Anammoximicrobium sp.]
MAKQVEKPKVERVSRQKAADRVVAELKRGSKTTLAELAKKAEQLVAASGGKTNESDAAYYVKRSLETAEALGVVKLTRPTDIGVEKVA